MSTLPDLVTPEEVRVRLQRPAPFAGDELARVEAVCEDASALVRFESRNKWLDPDDELIVKAPEIVLLIARRCAERAVRNPEGFSAETAADYSYQRNGAVGEGGLFLTEREKADLARAGGGFGGITTLQMTRGDYVDCTEWVYDQYGCDPIPWSEYPDCYTLD